jgi:hypothetical protein
VLVTRRITARAVEAIFMKTQSENPAGLHLRYIVTKASGEPVDPRARYFVLRFDRHGDDPAHVAACRKALRVYAAEIFPHLPRLSLELYAAIDAQEMPPRTPLSVIPDINIPLGALLPGE